MRSVFTSAAWAAFTIALVCPEAMAQEQRAAAQPEAEGVKALARETLAKAVDDPDALSRRFHFVTAEQRAAVMPLLSEALARWQRITRGLPRDANRPTMPAAFAVANLPTDPGDDDQVEVALADDTAVIEVDYVDRFHFRKSNDGWAWDAARQFGLDEEGEPGHFVRFLGMLNAALAEVEKQVERRSVTTVSAAAAAVDRAVVEAVMRPHMTDRADVPPPKVHADERRLVNQAGRIVSMAVSSDGTKLVTGAATASQPLRVWDAATGKPLREIRPEEAALFDVHCVRFLPDGKTIAALMAIWDSAGLTLAARHGEVAKPYDAMGHSMAVRLFDVETGSALPQLAKAEHMPLEYIAVSPDGNYLAGPSAFKTIVWDLTSRKALPPLPEGAGATFTPAGHLVLVQNGYAIAVHDPITGKELHRYPRSQNRGDDARGAAAVSPDGGRLAFGALQGVVIVDTATGKNMTRLPLPGGRGINRVNDVAYSSDGSRVLAAAGLFSQDVGPGGDIGGFIPVNRTRAACLWDATTGKRLATFDAYEKTVSAVAFVENERAALAASTDGTVRVWKLPPK